MSINRERLANLLKPSGFKLIPNSDPRGGAEYMRSSAIPDLSESIYYMLLGKRREAVAAFARVSVWFGYPTICDDRFIPEVGTDPTRGHAIITTSADAIAWERRLADVGPTRAEETARELGPALLLRTHQAREAVAGYLSVVEAHGGWTEIKKSATPAQRQAAERFLEFPIMSGPEAEDLYRSAALAIVRFHREVEKDHTVLRDMNPLENSELGSRVQLLVNRLKNGRTPVAEMSTH